MADATALLVQALMNRQQETNPWQQAGASLAQTQVPTMAGEGFWRNFLANAAPSALGGMMMAYGTNQANKNEAVLATKLQDAFKPGADPYAPLAGTSMQNIAPVIDLMNRQNQQEMVQDRASPEEVASIQNALKQMGSNIEIPQNVDRKTLDGIVAGAKLQAGAKPDPGDSINPYVEDIVRGAYGIPEDAPQLTQRDAMRLKETVRPLPDSQAESFGEAKQLLSDVERISGLIDQFDDSSPQRVFKAGKVKYIGGLFADPKSPEYKFYAELERIQKSLAKATEPGGRLSNQDFEILDNLIKGIPIYDTKETIKERMSTVLKQATSAINNKYESLKSAGYNMRDLKPIDASGALERINGGAPTAPVQPDNQAPPALNLQDPEQYKSYKEQYKAKLRQGG